MPWSAEMCEIGLIPGNTEPPYEYYLMQCYIMGMVINFLTHYGPVEGILVQQPELFGTCMQNAVPIQAFPPI
jgi:hypothetical protein